MRQLSVMGNSSSKLHVNYMYKCYSINSYGIINDCKFDISGSLVIMVKLTNEWTSCNLMSWTEDPTITLSGSLNVKNWIWSYTYATWIKIIDQDVLGIFIRTFSQKTAGCKQVM